MALKHRRAVVKEGMTSPCFNYQSGRTLQVYPSAGKTLRKRTLTLPSGSNSVLVQKVFQGVVKSMNTY